MIEKLALKTLPHSRPYKLQWLSENGELAIDRQVLICFSIGKYVDEILFDIVPMEASHLLLGRPWQDDKDVVCYGVTKKFSFVHKGKKVTLTPLSPSEVCEDQIKMRVKGEQERKEEKKKKTDKKREKHERREKKEKSEIVKKMKIKRKKYRAFSCEKKEVKRVMLARKPMYLLMPHDYCLSSVASSFPLGVEELLKKFGDVFPKYPSHGLPPLKGIEHQIDLILGASLPNKPTYRSNLEETK